MQPYQQSMRLNSRLAFFCIRVLLFALPVTAQTPTSSYSLSISINEVTLSFRAFNDQGLPRNDLKVADLHILDNGHVPAKISAFHVLEDIPIRAGILFDTSDSMRATLIQNRDIASEYAQSRLRRSADRVFIMNFGSTARLIQPWTGDPGILALSLRRISGYGERAHPGTAVYDSIYQACRSQFDAIDHGSTGNFLMLFSDGEDNASRITINQAIDACQRNHTAIYAFRTKNTLDSSGSGALSELTAMTGGRVLYENSSASKTDISDDLQSIENDQRNQYQLIYIPSELRHDGSFHHIQLTTNNLQDRVEVRSGYYAPKRK